MDLSGIQVLHALQMRNRSCEPKPVDAAAMSVALGRRRLLQKASPRQRLCHHHELLQAYSRLPQPPKGSFAPSHHGTIPKHCKSKASSQELLYIMLLFRLQLPHPQITEPSPRSKALSRPTFELFCPSECEPSGAHLRNSERSRKSTPRICHQRHYASRGVKGISDPELQLCTLLQSLPPSTSASLNSHRGAAEQSDNV